MGLARLIDEFGLTHEAAAKAVGRSRSAVTNLLRLTALAKPAQEYLLTGALEMGHARALLALPAAQQAATAARVVNGDLSVRETERLVFTLLNPAKRAARRKHTGTRRRYRAPRNRARGSARGESENRHREKGRRETGRSLLESRATGRDHRQIALTWQMPLAEDDAHSKHRALVARFCLRHPRQRTLKGAE